MPLSWIMKTISSRMLKPDIFIDAVMAKRNTGTTMDKAPMVIALGPGFIAGRDVHFVVETNPNSHFLGRVIIGRAVGGRYVRSIPDSGHAPGEDTEKS